MASDWANQRVGGKFAVRHGDATIDFDWAAEAASSVQWAAFYSDCEHEVYEVTDGHRITLTYNLFLTARTDLQTGCQLSLDATQLPFAKLLKTALCDPGFMFRGGKLGIYLTHRYPHTNAVLSKLLPACLKGVDMNIYESARALGLQSFMGCTTKASLNIDDYQEMYDYEDSEDENDVWGRYYPFLMDFHEEEGYGEDGPRDLGDAEDMRHGVFEMLNGSRYSEVQSAGLAVRSHADSLVLWKLTACVVRERG